MLQITLERLSLDVCGSGDDSYGDELRSLKRMTECGHVFVCLQWVGAARPLLLSHILSCIHIHYIDQLLEEAKGHKYHTAGPKTHSSFGNSLTFPLKSCFLMVIS